MKKYFYVLLGILVIILQVQCSKSGNNPKTVNETTTGGVDEIVELFETFNHDQVNRLEYYGDADIILGFDAEKYDLSEEGIINEFRSLLKKHFKESGLLPLGTLDFNDVLKLDDRKKMGFLVIVLVKGNEYPIVWNVELLAGSFDDMDLFNDELLGFSSKEKIKQDVMDAIDMLVGELAKFYFRYREN